MRVQGYQMADWAQYEFRTTYKMGWQNILCMAKALYEYMGGVVIMHAKEIGGEIDMISIKSENDVLSIPEGSMLEVRGLNKVYDDMPFRFFFFNQTDIVRMLLPPHYLSAFKKSETEFLNDEEKMHTFDKFMDAVEINAYSIFSEYNAIREATDALVHALLMKENFAENRVYKTKNEYCEVNLTEVCKRIVENWKTLR